MRGRALVAVTVAASLAMAGGFVLTPVALSGGSFAYQTAPDSTVASVVKSPYTTRCWGGVNQACDDLYNVPSDGYNADSVSQVVSSIAVAASSSGFAPTLADLLPTVPEIAIGLGGAFVGYEVGNLFYNWLSSDWGGLPASSAPCGTASVNGSQCDVVRVLAGTRVCIGNTFNGNANWWTVPTNGMLLETTVSAYQDWTFISACSGGGLQPVTVEPAYSSSPESAVNALGYSAKETDTGLHGVHSREAYVWFQPGSGSYDFSLTSVGTSSVPTDVTCRGTGWNGYGCTGTTFNNANPSDATVATALRNLLSQDEYGVSSLTISCVLSGDCTSTAVDTTFTMPDCYGDTVSDCLASMNWLGFTGTLEQSIAATPDYTLPAGVVLSTSPRAGLLASQPWRARSPMPTRTQIVAVGSSKTLMARRVRTSRMPSM